MNKLLVILLMILFAGFSFASDQIVKEQAMDKEGTSIEPLPTITVQQRIKAYQMSRSKANLNEGFESGAIPINWTILNMDGGTQQWMAYSSTTYAHSGSYSARVRYESSSLDNDDWLITPPLNIQPGVDDTLKFWVRTYSNSYSDPFEVRLSTTGTDTADFNVLLFDTTGYMGDYMQLVFPLDAYDGQVVYVAIHYTGAYDWYVYADDFEGPEVYVPPTPTFTTPFSEIDLNQNHSLVPVNEPASEYVYITNTGGGDLVINSINTSSSDITTSVSSLTIPPGGTDSVLVTWTPSTVAMDTGWVEFVHNATTSPDTVALTLQSVPAGSWVIDFELPYPDWWVPGGYGFTLHGLWGYSSINNHWGDQGSWKSGSSGKDTTYIYTPRLDLTSGPTQMSFYHKGFSTGDDTVEVIVSSDGGSTWSLLGKVTNTGSDWKYQVYDLSAYAGNDNVIIGWHYYYPSGSTSGSSFYMDDLSLPQRYLSPTGILYASVSQIDFGAVLVGDTAYYDVELSNTGSTLTINSITSDNPDFTILNAPATIPPFGTETFTVQFIPSTGGTISGNISIDHDGVNGTDEVLVIPVTGSGLAPHTLNYADDFESSASLNNYLFTSDGGDAVFTIYGGYSSVMPISGDSMLAIWSANSGVRVDAKADLVLDLSTAVNPEISFALGTYSLEAGLDSGWVDIYDGTWHHAIVGLSGTNPLTQFTFNVGAEGWNKINNFIVRFRGNMNYPMNSDGVFVDNVSVYDQIQWANLQWPPSTTTIPGDSTEYIYGQVWIDGVTNQTGPTPGLVAEVGYGPDGSMPYDTLTGEVNPDWVWFPAEFNIDTGPFGPDNDEFKGKIVAYEVGSYDYAYRYSWNGAPWVYADQDGTDNGYDPGQAGTLIVAPSQPIVISEIMYNPNDNLQGSDTNYEYVELANVGIDTVDISGWQFIDGFDYTFPAGTKIPPGEYIVVARDPASVGLFYGITNMVGPFAGGALSNGGEMIILADANGVPVDTVDYDDWEPWPIDGDGYGPSIEVINLLEDNNDPANWNASLSLFGTPGAPNQVPPPPIPASIYMVQYTIDPSGTSPLQGFNVQVSGTVTEDYFVDGGIVIQDSAAAWHGIQVLTRNHLPIGTQVTVEGWVVEWYDRTVLVGTQVTDLGGGTVPDPLPVAINMVNTGSPTAEAYECVLVEVNNVTVSDENTGYGEWEVTDGVDFLRVDNGDYTYTPALGDSLEALRGVLNYSFGDFKIAPRSDDDFVFPVYILYEDFSDGTLPAGWTIVDSIGGGEIWRFDNPGGRVINTTTASNGFAIFDSDWYGSGGGPENCDLISPVFDCSAFSQVLFSFEHYFQSGYGGAAEVFVSNDSGATWISLASWSTSSTANAQKEVYDISTYAAGNSNVMVKFNWIGDYSWYWAVDDVVISGPGTIAGNVTAASSGSPLENAMVIAGTDTAYTDANGNYTLTVPGGIYNVTAVKDGYNPQIAEFVVVIPGQTKTLDFALTAPTMDLDVTSIDTSLQIGDTLEVPITISNNGDGPLNYHLTVSPGIKKQTDYTKYNASGIPSVLKNIKPTNDQSSFHAENISDQDTVIIHFDGPYSNNGIGTNGAASWICAARFTADELMPYYGEYGITGVQIHIRDASFTNVTVKIWEGGSFGDPGAEIYSQDITAQVIVGDWTYHALTTPIPLLSGNEYWIGYAIDATGDHPSSVDAGPAVPGKGDWMYFGGIWQEISTGFGLDYNWNIRGVLTSDAGYWLSVAPVSGTVAAGQQEVVTAKLDASVFAGDTVVSANINFYSDPNVGSPVVPVNLTVTPLGYTLNGTVGLSDFPADLSGTRVELVQGANTWVDSTDVNGYYEFAAVLPGTYDMHFIHTGYHQFDTTLTISANTTLDVMLMKIVSPPSGVTATQVGFTEVVEVNWMAPGSKFFYGLARGQEEHNWLYSLDGMRDILLGYNVYRTDVGLLNIGGLVTDTFYVDTTVVFDSTYYYYVTAVYDPEGESDPSDTAMVTVHTTPGEILLVDDDGSNGGSYEDISPVYIAALNQLNAMYGTTYDYYEVPYGGDGPDAATLGLYHTVIWFTGETWNSTYDPTLTATDEANLALYLGNGGNLFLVAQDYFWDVYPSAGAFSAGQFPYDFLGVTSTTQDAWSTIGPLTATGVSGSFTDGMTFTVNSPFVTNGTYLYVDDVVTSAGNYLFSHTGPTGNSGVYYDGGTFRTVFTTLEFAGMQDGSAPNTKAEFLYRVLNFLGVPSGLGQTQFGIPTVFDLKPNYPNPFNPSTTIKYQLPKAVDVHLEIYNILGQRVKTLVNKKAEAGYYEVVWDGTNDFGQKVASGLYIYRIKAGDYVKSYKMILMK